MKGGVIGQIKIQRDFCSPEHRDAFFLRELEMQRVWA